MWGKVSLGTLLFQFYLWGPPPSAALAVFCYTLRFGGGKPPPYGETGNVGDLNAGPP